MSLRHKKNTTGVKMNVMKNIFRIFSVFSASFVLFAAFASGCVSRGGAPGGGGAKVGITTKADAENEKREGAKLITAIMSGESGDFIKLLPEEMRSRFGVKEFKTARKNISDNLGEIVSFKYIDTLEMPSLRPNIWKVRFKRVTKDGKEVFQETLFRVVFGKADGRLCVISFGFL